MFQGFIYRICFFVCFWENFNDFAKLIMPSCPFCFFLICLAQKPRSLPWREYFALSASVWLPPSVAYCSQFTSNSELLLHWVSIHLFMLFLLQNSFLILGDTNVLLCFSSRCFHDIFPNSYAELKPAPLNSYKYSAEFYHCTIFRLPKNKNSLSFDFQHLVGCSIQI